MSKLISDIPVLFKGVNKSRVNIPFLQYDFNNEGHIDFRDFTNPLTDWHL